MKCVTWELGTKFLKCSKMASRMDCEENLGKLPLVAPCESDMLDEKPTFQLKLDEGASDEESLNGGSTNSSETTTVKTNRGYRVGKKAKKTKLGFRCTNFLKVRSETVAVSRRIGV